MIQKTANFIGAVLMVAGTTIGAAMLALPVSTGLMGFYPTVALFLGYWVLMTFTAFLILEVTLWSEGDINLITMAKMTLGRIGEILTWTFYLFLLYALTTAYLAGSSPFFLSVIEAATGAALPHWIGPLPMIAIFSFFVYRGAHSVDLVNRFMMLGLILTYAILTLWLSTQINPTYILHSNWSAVNIALSVVATSFGYHIIIPTLTRYLKHDVKYLQWTLIVGGLIPLVIYIFWDYVCIGAIPLRDIKAGFADGKDAIALLNISSGLMAIVAQSMRFFAIVTSFLGVSLSLRDFLADGVHIKKTFSGKIFLYILTFVPPLIIAFTDPRSFLSALEYAGVFGVVLLLALLPVLMVWSGRYYNSFPSTHFRTPGGKVALVIAGSVSLLIILVEIGNKIGYFAN